MITVLSFPERLYAIPPVGSVSFLTASLTPIVSSLLLPLSVRIIVTALPPTQSVIRMVNVSMLVVLPVLPLLVNVHNVTLILIVLVTPVVCFLVMQLEENALSAWMKETVSNLANPHAGQRTDAV